MSRRKNRFFFGGRLLILLGTFILIYNLGVLGFYEMYFCFKNNIIIRQYIKMKIDEQPQWHEYTWKIFESIWWNLPTFYVFNQIIIILMEQGSDRAPNRTSKKWVKIKWCTVISKHQNKEKSRSIARRFVTPFGFCESTSSPFRE